MPFRWLRACGAVLAVGFGVNTLAPGLPHGCLPDASGGAPHHQVAEAPVASGTGHEHKHDPTPSDPSKAPNCCVGHSCCASRVVVSATPHVVALPAQLIRLVRTSGRALPSRPLPRYTLPFANAPPLLA